MKEIITRWLWMAAKIGGIIVLFALALSLTGCGTPRYGTKCPSEGMVGY